MLLVTLNHPIMAGCIRRGRTDYFPEGKSKTYLSETGSQFPAGTGDIDPMGFTRDEDGNWSGRAFVVVYGPHNKVWIDAETIRDTKCSNIANCWWIDSTIIAGCLKILDAEESGMQAALDVIFADTVNSK